MTCIDGEVEMEMECLPRFAYGAEAADWSGGELGEAIASGGDGVELQLTSDMELSIEDGAARGTLSLREDETGFCAVTWGDGDLGGPRSAPEALERLDSTEEFWRNWLRDGDFPDHPWRIHLQRSALVLKGLTYTPSGAIVAAPTTSLPETPGGERNWDYRYSWIRDSTFSLWALHTLGFDQEARDFMRFVVDVCREDPNLQIMYGIGGEKQLTESTLDHLDGYGGARPVRIGNGAFDQRQNDVWGALLDSIYLHEKALRGTGTPADRELIGEQVEAAIAAWPHPDQGIWESRGRAAALRLLEADDLGRGRPRRPPRPQRRLGRDRRRVGDDRGRDPRGDPRARRPRRRLPPALRDRRARRLDPADPAGPLPAPRRPAGARHGRGDRRRADRARPRPPLQGRGDRRRPERRGGHLPDLLLLAGLGALGDRRAEAGAGALRAAARGRPAGSTSTPRSWRRRSGRHLGNFPQAFTHLALINAVSHVIADEQREDGGVTAVFSEMGGVREGV